MALQEIGPRFTLKLRYLKKGLPAVKNLGAPSKPLQFDDAEAESRDVDMPDAQEQEQEAVAGSQNYVRKEVVPPTEDEYLWMWKVRNLNMSYRAQYLHGPYLIAGVRDDETDVLPISWHTYITHMYLLLCTQTMHLPSAYLAMYA